MLNDKQIVEKMYAGFLGMCAGIRLGAPVEPTCWSFERIKDVYGTINDYTKEYKNFAADDDSNGPVYFLRALIDYAEDREMEANDVGKAWLDFAREGIGMFWWGGDQVSTEHTAYLNLKKGISAPKSGSIEVNGEIMAEQIGGQIFIDTWGLLFPGDINKAAEYAEKAASVSHDKNGLYGARFIAACISAAFDTNSILEIVEKGQSVIPKDSLYNQLIEDVKEFYHQHPDNYELCRQFLEDNWGYDKYTGVCHIIPNAGICVLSLLYGEGKLDKTIEIATMCAWDTDCNAGNVGTILGVYEGLSGVPSRYRKPINDNIVISGVVGSWNTMDIPNFITELAYWSYKINNKEIPEFIDQKKKIGKVDFDFEFSGATHGFRTDNSFKTELHANDKFGKNSNGSLAILLDRMFDEDESHVFYKPFYRREDFSDERYKPTFSPQVYSGQQLNLSVFLEQWLGEDIFVEPYIRITDSKERLYGGKVKIKANSWKDISYIIPDTEGSFIDEIGIRVSTNSVLNNRLFGRLYVDNFEVSGKSNYSIDFSKQAIEFLCVTPFAHNLGEYSLEKEGMLVKSTYEGSSSLTGDYYNQDIDITTTITPIKGESHLVNFRSKGIRRGYTIGFSEAGKVTLTVHNFGEKQLVNKDYNWSVNKKYKFRIKAIGTKIKFYINNELIIEYDDSTHRHGLFGYTSLSESESLVGNFNVIEL